MKRFLYSVGIGCYATGVRVAALTNDKARKMVEGWSRTFGRLSMAPVGKGKTAWFHASSLGEFEQTRPVLEEFRKRHPEYSSRRRDTRCGRIMREPTLCAICHPTHGATPPGF